MLNELRRFISSRLPELHKQMESLPLGDCLEVLNALTGLRLQGTEPISSGSWKFLTKLRQMEERGSLYLVGLVAATKKIQQIRLRQTNP